MDVVSVCHGNFVEFHAASSCFPFCAIPACPSCLDSQVCLVVCSRPMVSCRRYGGGAWSWIELAGPPNILRADVIGHDVGVVGRQAGRRDGWATRTREERTEQDRTGQPRPRRWPLDA